MARVPDMQNPLLDQIAHELHTLTPLRFVPEMAGQGKQLWERETPAVRDIYRERARRFVAGDMSVAPWAVGAANNGAIVALVEPPPQPTS